MTHHLSGWRWAGIVSAIAAFGCAPSAGARAREAPCAPIPAPPDPPPDIAPTPAPPPPNRDDENPAYLEPDPPDPDTEPDGDPQDPIVVFRVFPPFVTLTVDGRPVRSNAKVHLAAGTHTLSVEDDCCDAHHQVFAVAPAEPEGSAAVQIVAVRLTPRDALVRVAGAPPQSVVVCTQGIILVPSTTTAVHLDGASARVICTFYPGEALEEVLLHAGENVIPWPSISAGSSAPTPQ